MKNNNNNNYDNNNNKKKIFQLGFRRSGGLILTNALEIAEKKIAFHNIRTAKYCYMQFLAIIMNNNLKEKNKILLKELNNYDGFFNLTFEFPDHWFNFYNYFKQIEEQNKGSQFIITVRPILEYILSLIFLYKRSKVLYAKNINTKKIFEWIDDYFNHCIEVRDYFKLSHIKKRSELFVFIPGKIKPEDLLKKMNVYLYPNVKINISDYSELKFDKNDYNEFINDKILKKIHENLHLHGDPSELKWWN